MSNGTFTDVSVNPSEARAASARVTKDREQIEEAIKVLDKNIKAFDDKSEVQWLHYFREDWEKFYNGPFKTVCTGLVGQANNLQVAAETAETLNESNSFR